MGGLRKSFSLDYLKVQLHRFKGSTLQLMGLSATFEQPSEWSITGGTGDLAMARGVVKVKFHEVVKDGDTWELSFHGFCSMQVRRVFIY